MSFKDLYEGKQIPFGWVFKPLKNAFLWGKDLIHYYLVRKFKLKG